MITYIYCSSYEHLFFSLYLKLKGEQVKIITHYENIVAVCKLINIPHIKFDGMLLTFKNCYKVFGFKRKLDLLIKLIDIKPDDVFILPTHRKMFDAFYLAKELSKNRTVCYNFQSVVTKDVYKAPKGKPFFFRGILLKFLLKIVLGLDLMYYQGFGYPTIGIGDKFVEKHGLKKYLVNLSPVDIHLYVTKNICLENTLLNCFLEGRV